jgi:hypothetical protein
MSKQDKVSMYIEEILPDNTITRAWHDYFPDNSPDDYIKGTRANMHKRDRGERILSIKINDQDYWDLDPSTKNPAPPEDKPRSTPLY